MSRQSILEKIRLKTDELEEAYRQLAIDYTKTGCDAAAINALEKAMKIRDVIRGK